MTKISKLLFILTITFVVGIVFSANAAWDTSIFISTANTPSCGPRHETLRGQWQCIKKIDDQSCINVAPVKSSRGYGISSPVCTRGDYWCSRNKDQCNNPNQKRCAWKNGKCLAKNGDSGAKPHYGYDYSARCGDAYYAPCDGYFRNNKRDGLEFECKICGKKYVYKFRHNPKSEKQPGNYKKGEYIGQVGSVNTNACHAHIEIMGPTGASGQEALMDPFAPGFNDYVCSCGNSSQTMDRSECFKGKDPGGTYTEPTVTDDGRVYENGQSVGGDSILNENMGSSHDPDCVYDAVISRYSQMGCMFCKPFKIIFNTASIMAKKSYDLFAKGLVPLIMVGFAIWLALIILKTVSTFNKVEPRIFIKTILGQTFKVLVIVLLLQGPLKQIIGYTIDPVFSTGLKIVQLSAPYALNDPTSCGLDDTVVEDGGLSASLGNGILCTIKTVQDKLMSIVAMGRVCHCLGWEHVMKGFIPNLAYILTALILMSAGFILIFVYPFLLVDTILRLAAVVALLPLVLAAYALNMDYLKKIWETFLNAVFTFIFMALVITIISTMAEQYTTDLLNSSLFNSNLGSVLWFTTGGMKLGFICFLGWSVLNEIKPFSSKFGGGLKLEAGSKVGGTALQAADKFAVKPVEKAAKTAAVATASTVHKNLSHLHRQVNAARIQSFGKKAVDDNGNLMLDDDGNQLYVDRSLRPLNLLRKLTGKKTFRSYTTDANGNVMETKTTLKGDYTVGADGKVSMTGKGTKKVIQTDAFGVLEKAQNANETSANIKVNMGRRKLLKKDGSLDKHNFDLFMQNSLLSDQEKQVAIVQQLVIERMSSYVGGRLDGVYKKRNAKTIKDENGNTHIIIEQINKNGSFSTFEAEFGKNDRVMTTVRTVDASGNAVEYKTDGVIQREAVKEGEKTSYKYAVSKKYSHIERPVHTNGSLDRRIDRDDILFEQEDLERFGKQVLYRGNRAYNLEGFM